MRFKLNREIVLVGSLIAILALFLLAAGMVNLQLKPAEHFILAGVTSGPPPTGVLNEISALSLLQQMILFGGILLLAILLIALLSPDARKRLLKALVRTVLLMLVVYWAIERFRRPEPVPLNAAGQSAAGNQPPITGTPAAFTPPAIPVWLAYITSLAVILALIGMGWWIWRRTHQPRSPVGELAGIARSTLEDISTGGDWEDAVIQCYARMSEAVRKQRGLRRERAMTPSEFATRLVQSGLPLDPVRRLTRLFEQVRYGTRRSSREQTEEAVTCLTAIMHSVGEAG
jgi:hypothetical protein